MIPKIIHFCWFGGGKKKRGDRKLYAKLAQIFAGL